MRGRFDEQGPLGAQPTKASPLVGLILFPQTLPRWWSAAWRWGHWSAKTGLPVPAWQSQSVVGPLWARWVMRSLPLVQEVFQGTGSPERVRGSRSTRGGMGVSRW